MPNFEMRRLDNLHHGIWGVRRIIALVSHNVRPAKRNERFADSHTELTFRHVTHQTVGAAGLLGALTVLSGDSAFGIEVALTNAVHTLSCGALCFGTQLRRNLGQHAHISSCRWVPATGRLERASCFL